MLNLLKVKKLELGKLANKPNLETITRYSENLIACFLKETKIIFDKLIYVGMCISDISITLMYDFH